MSLTRNFSEAMSKKLVRITSVKASPNFSMEVDGRVNRVLSVTWSAEEDELVQFVNDDQQYSGNLILPDSFTLMELDAFKEAVQKRIDEGTLSVYGYEWPVSVISEGSAIAYINPAKPNNAPLMTIRRAWPRDNEENAVLAIVRAQVKKCIEKGKLKPVEG